MKISESSGKKEEFNEEIVEIQEKQRKCKERIEELIEDRKIIEKLQKDKLELMKEEVELMKEEVEIMKEMMKNTAEIMEKQLKDVAAWFSGV
ncbi:hypothetical protein L195_g009542 [Trifolium pratense]|uniref:Uncharacterized protein n=1 Tax=Trifolium pratense TaxID=57577 RepID=A0A2K3PC73_TRIPR|nr:hypothetical protein L195_g009542 [Trifolium pratense]